MRLCANWKRLMLVLSIAFGVTANAVNASASVFTWAGPAGNNTTDWSVGPWTLDSGEGTFPDAIDDVANLTRNINGSTTTNIVLDANRTIGTLNIGDPSSAFGAYRIDGPNTLIFEVSAGSAAINKPAGVNNSTFVDGISAAIQLNSDLVVNNTLTQGNARIQLTGAISENGGPKTITNAGPGRVEFLGQSTFTGGVVGAAGSGAITLGAQVATSSDFANGTGPLGLGTVTLNDTQLIYTSINGLVSTLENAIQLNGVGVGEGDRLTTNGFSTQVGVLSGGGFRKTGNNTLALAASNVYVGTTTVASGTLQIGGVADPTLPTAGTVGTLGTGDVVLNVGDDIGHLSFARSDTHTVSNNISGTGSVQQVATGAGTTILTGANTYTGVTTVDAGTLLVNGTHTGGGAYSVGFDATLGGNGTIGAQVNIAGGGFLAPGTTIGSLDVDSASIAGTLQIQFNGDSGTIDLLNVATSLDISAATLNFANLGSANLAPGNYAFATYGQLVGDSFASVTGLPSGFSIDYDYLGNQIALVTGGRPGDFNGDGNVDGADFVIWQTNFPNNTGTATLATGDANGDGNVDGADFVIWQTNFPFTAGSGATPVPEPQAVVLMLLGAAISLRIGARSKFGPSRKD